MGYCFEVKIQIEILNLGETTNPEEGRYLIPFRDENVGMDK